MKRQATDEPWKYRTRQRLGFVAGFAAAVFLVHKANLSIPQTQEPMNMIPAANGRTRSQKVTRMYWQRIIKPGTTNSTALCFWCHGYLTCPIPSQSARSRALARAVDRPTTRTLLEVWEEMKLVLDTMTSNTGPLSSPANRHNGTVKSECLCKKSYILVPLHWYGFGNISLW